MLDIASQDLLQLPYRLPDVLGDVRELRAPVIAVITPLRNALREYRARRR